MALRGFRKKWIECIRSVAQNGFVGVKINGIESIFFPYWKGTKAG